MSTALRSTQTNKSYLASIRPVIGRQINGVRACSANRKEISKAVIRDWQRRRWISKLAKARLSKVILLISAEQSCGGGVMKLEPWMSSDCPNQRSSTGNDCAQKLGNDNNDLLRTHNRGLGVLGKSGSLGSGHSQVSTSPHPEQ